MPPMTELSLMATYSNVGSKAFTSPLMESFKHSIKRNTRLFSVMLGTTIAILWNSSIYALTIVVCLKVAISLKYSSSSFCSNLSIILWLNSSNVFTSTWPCVMTPCCHQSYATSSKLSDVNCIALSSYMGLRERYV